MKAIAKSILRVIRDYFRRPKGFRRRTLVRFGPSVSVSGPLNVGDYTFIGARAVIGPCSVNIGRYSSIGPDVLIGLNAHPIDHPSTSAVFYSPEWGRSRDRRAEFNTKTITIGNDVWIGTRAIIMPGVSIGDGAVVGAGAIVTHDVEPFAVAVGIPAEVVKYRFPREIIDSLQKTCWWESCFEDLDFDAFCEHYSGGSLLRSEH